MALQLNKTLRIAPNPFDPLPIAFYVHPDGNLSWSVFSEALIDVTLFGICPISDVSILAAPIHDHSFIKAASSRILVSNATAERVADALGIAIQAEAVAA